MVAQPVKCLRLPMQFLRFPILVQHPKHVSGTSMHIGVMLGSPTPRFFGVLKHRLDDTIFHDAFRWHLVTYLAMPFGQGKTRNRT